MRFYTFEINGRRRFGAELSGQLIDLPVAYALLTEGREPRAGGLPAIPTNVLDFIRVGAPALQAARETIEFMKKRPAAPVGEQLAYPIDIVKILPPLTRPGKIIAASNLQKVGEERQFYAKFPSAIAATGEPITLPRGVAELHVQPSIAAVIGARLRNAPEELANQSIFGFTMLNDISASTLSEQQTLARNADGFAPLGPCIVTPDELGNKAAEMSGSLGPVAAFLSRIMTLLPGDIVSVPAAAAFSVRAGESAGVELPLLGRLENPIIAQEHR